MTGIEVRNLGEIAVVSMARGKANALNAAMLDAMAEHLRTASQSEARAIVLSSESTGFFSSGFDVQEVFAYDRSQMREFFGGFLRLYEQILQIPQPTVGAIRGHAFAGGAILAMACDERVFADGKGGFALNEINLGVVLTPGIVQLAVEVLGRHTASSLLLSGRALTPEEALGCGLATELAPEPDVVATAVARAEKLAEKPPQAYAAIKALLRGTTGELTDATDASILEVFLDHWFSDEAIDGRQALVESLQRRS